MAYLRELFPQTCCQCDKRAMWELINARNAHLGWYCKRHAVVALARQEREEAETW